MENLKRLDTKQAADYLAEIGAKATPGTLEVWRSQGRGPRFFKIGRMVRYDPRDLWRFAQGRPVETVDSIEARQQAGARVGVVG